MRGVQVLGQGGQVLGKGIQVLGQGVQEPGYGMLPSTVYGEQPWRSLYKTASRVKIGATQSLEVQYGIRLHHSDTFLS